MSLERDREEPNAIQTNLGAIFVSLELSRSTWLIRSLSPGGGAKMSKHADAWRQCHRAPGALCATSGESADEDRGGLPICRDPGGRPRRILDPSGAAGGRDRKPRDRSGLDRDLAPAPTGKDRQDRRRSADSSAAGVQARRTSGVGTLTIAHTRGGKPRARHRVYRGCRPGRGRSRNRSMPSSS